MRKAIVSPGAVMKANTDLQSLAKSIGRFVDGNKSATGASSGEFVVLLNSTISGRTDGLYTASKAIPANTAIDSSYLTASSTGGLNALNAKITALDSKFVIPEVTDLDNATENNMAYRFNTGALHNPGYNYGIVFVLSEGNNARQFAVSRGGTDTGTISMRSRSSSAVWGEWQHLALKSEVDAQKTIYVQLNNQTIAGSASSAETTTFDLSSHIPSGYSIWSAEMQIRDGSSFYNLPWISPNITQATWIERILNTGVIIKNKADWSGNRIVTFTLNCKRN